MHSRIKKLLLQVAKAIAPFKPLLEWMVGIECFISSNWVKMAHKHLMMVSWRIPPQPEHFDHQIDQYYLWIKSRNPQWVERGIYSSLALKEGKLLELCCGDGFNARNFYSLKANEVVACDFDLKAIRTAKKKNSAFNITFKIADIRTHMPDGYYENIIWDAAIEHFTDMEIKNILSDIKKRLTPDGILSGHTVVEREDGQKQLSHHEYEVKNKEDLLRYLSPFFSNVLVFETKYPSRQNLYFWASDSEIPFGHGWPHFSKKENM